MKLKHDDLLSNYAFKCNLRPCTPELPAQCVLPAFASGLMWGVAQVCWFVANNRLSFSVSFPIMSSLPGLVGAAWGRGALLYSPTIQLNLSRFDTTETPPNSTQLTGYSSR